MEYGDLDIDSPYKDAVYDNSSVFLKFCIPNNDIFIVYKYVVPPLTFPQYF